MRKIINVYKECDEYGTLVIESTRYDSVSVIFDSVFKQHLLKFNWCYERTKGVVYTMDLTMRMSKTLGCNGPKFYLQKYVSYLHTGRTDMLWVRRHKWDYRIAHGVMRPQDTL